MTRIIQYESNGAEYTGTANEDKEMTEEEAEYVFVPTAHPQNDNECINNMQKKIYTLKFGIWSQIYSSYCYAENSDKKTVDIEKQFKQACKLIFNEDEDETKTS